jgi:hypothetical protein
MLAQAQAQGLPERAELVQREIDALAEELARATGLGRRSRRLGSTAERARVNVTRAIASAIARIRTQHPSLGEHLARTIRTGTSCAYRPSGGSLPEPCV